MEADKDSRGRELKPISVKDLSVGIQSLLNVVNNMRASVTEVQVELANIQGQVDALYDEPTINPPSSR